MIGISATHGYPLWYHGVTNLGFPALQKKMLDNEKIKCGRMFDPWVGNQYRTSGLFGLRILILGEAHYGKPENAGASHTIEVVRALGQQRRFRFFTATRSLILGTRGWIPDKERAAFWETVAYCNFIQSFPGASPRIRPSPEMWSAGQEPLLYTIRELEPHLVIALGKELNRSLPEIPDGVHLCGVSHPSGRGFRLDVLQPIVRSAIEKAGGKFPSVESSAQS